MTRPSRIPFLALLVAAPLGAQQPTPAPAAAAPVIECSVDFSQPKELVALYNITRPRAIKAEPGEERAKLAKDILKAVNTPKLKGANPQASDMLTGEMLVIWMMQPESPATATRGALNMGEPQSEVIDLAKAADSLFTSVATANPSCAGDIKIWRGSKPWQDRINGAFKALQADQPDSAEMLAKASMVLERTAPYAERVLAAVAQARKQPAESLKHLEAALALTADDTLYLEDRRAVQFQIGQTGLEYGETQPEPARTAILRHAADVLLTLATESPSADATSYALSGMSMAGMSLKDTTLFTKCFDVVDRRVAEYDDMSRLQAAVCASRAGKPSDAVKMFQATLAKNPNSRDALYNAAALMYDQRRGSEMLPLVSKLVELDPGNPDDLSLFAYAYNVLHEQSKAAAAPAAKPAPGAKPAPAAPKSTWIDSVSKYMKLSDDMPQRVVMVQFDRLADKATLAGEIENRSKAAHSYDLAMEFLDIAGAVVDKQVITVGPVAPGQTGAFTFTVAKPKVAAWRYAPITAK